VWKKKGDPVMKTSIAELNVMTESEKRYRIYERMEEMYESNGDWTNALKAKWGMAAVAQSNLGVH
jgi:hypothetical protein